MDIKEICPCPKLTCPNHGYCDKCTSRHLRLGFLNYCSFHTILPTIRKAIDEAPESSLATKLDDLMQAQLKAYDSLMDEHGLSHDSQDRLLKMVAKHSDH